MTDRIPPALLQKRLYINLGNRVNELSRTYPDRLRRVGDTVFLRLPLYPMMGRCAICHSAEPMYAVWATDADLGYGFLCVVCDDGLWDTSTAVAVLPSS